MIAFSDGPAAFVLGGAVRLGAAVIFAQSGWHALRDFVAHEDAVRAYRLLPERLARPVAALLAAANVAVAPLLLPAATARWAAGAACALLLLYAIAMKINLVRGRTDIACGCGGPGQRISPLLVSRNLLLAGLIARASVCPLAGPVDVLSLVSIVGGGISFAALYFAAAQLLANEAALQGTRA